MAWSRWRLFVRRSRMTISEIVTVVFSFSAIIISFWAAWVTSAQRRNSEKEMALRTYGEAIQGVLNLKRTFAERPTAFEKQMEFAPSIRELIPNYMDTPSFLTFAGGM